MCEVAEIAASFTETASQFGTVIRPACLLEAEAPTSVHGIGVDEMQSSPPFPVAIANFCSFLRGSASYALNTYTGDGTNDDNEECQPEVRMPTPVVFLAGHNGKRYDGHILVHSCIRYGLPVAHLGQLKWLDTIDVVRDCGSARCAKLQCRAQLVPTQGLHTHRALDDVIDLHAVVCHVAESFGVQLQRLLKPFDVVSFRSDLAVAS